MDTYKVAEVDERQGVVWLSCTNQQGAHEILAELRQNFPQWRVRPDEECASDSGDEMGWVVDKCRGKHRYALVANTPVMFQGMGAVCLSPRTIERAICWPFVRIQE